MCALYWHPFNYDHFSSSNFTSTFIGDVFHFLTSLIITTTAAKVIWRQTGGTAVTQFSADI